MRNFGFGNLPYLIGHLLGKNLYALHVPFQTEFSCNDDALELCSLQKLLGYTSPSPKGEEGKATYTQLYTVSRKIVKDCSCCVWSRILSSLNSAKLNLYFL